MTKIILYFQRNLSFSIRNFYKGTKQLFNQPHTLAVIGSRKSTSYTTQALEYLFPSFQQIQMTIISGLAYGADSKRIKSLSNTIYPP